MNEIHKKKNIIDRGRSGWDPLSSAIILLLLWPEPMNPDPEPQPTLSQEVQPEPQNRPWGCKPHMTRVQGSGRPK